MKKKVLIIIVIVALIAGGVLLDIFLGNSKIKRNLTNCLEIHTDATAVDGGIAVSYYNKRLHKHYVVSSSEPRVNGQLKSKETIKVYDFTDEELEELEDRIVYCTEEELKEYKWENAVTNIVEDRRGGGLKIGYLKEN